ncbi:MAG: 1-acyl-sn-glycerol-3-phosphate acyltransferase [Gemmatimonadota bacterium]|nr:1-acyl-sn-glycerol-3-phosphate acyltransferase [Gemmatimonadota bacterium]
MRAFLRACLVAANLVLSTTILGTSVLIAALFRVRDRPGSPYDWAPRLWGKSHLWVAGTRIVEHGAEHKGGPSHIYVANHCANFDIFALASQLPWIKFVVKLELFRVPILGRAMLAAGMIPIERQNRKAAFESYALASRRIEAGASIAVYPEGTRGNAYPLRHFKKGPFVLAVQARAAIVPVVMHGVLEVQRKGEFRVHPGTIHMHYLPPIETAGLTYEDRDALARRTYDAMAECLRREYGVESPGYDET